MLKTCNFATAPEICYLGPTLTQLPSLGPYQKHNLHVFMLYRSWVRTLPNPLCYRGLCLIHSVTTQFSSTCNSGWIIDLWEDILVGSFWDLLLVGPSVSYCNNAYRFLYDVLCTKAPCMALIINMLFVLRWPCWTCCVLLLQ